MPNRSGSVVLQMILSVAAALTACSESQSGWFELPEPPTAFFRYEDVHFVDQNIGRIVGYEHQYYRTSNGGASWELVPDTPSHFYRSVAFVSEQRGWIGTVDSTAPLLQTSDGGSTWSVVPGLPSFVSGICGMWVLDEQTVFGSGEYNGPGAALIKTTNAGTTWQAVDLSAMASGVVDCYFSSPSHGVVVGHTLDLSDHRTVVLLTTDGGSTWSTRYSGTREGAHGWKISFPSPQVGYCAIDHSPSGQQYILKTTDGGLSWTELPSVTNLRQQGIGFLNETTGWVGGWGGTGVTSITTDGGATWQSDPWGVNVNSIVVLTDGVAFAAGKRAYRYVTPAAVDPNSGRDQALIQVLGNPFRGETVLSYRVPEASHVRLSIVSPQGHEISRPVDGLHESGTYSTRWSAVDRDGQSVPTGVYFLKLTLGSRIESGRLLVLK